MELPWIPVARWPSAAVWEYACRLGKITKGRFWNDDPRLVYLKVQSGWFTLV